MAGRQAAKITLQQTLWRRLQSAAPRLVSALPEFDHQEGREESRPDRQECLRHVGTEVDAGPFSLADQIVPRKLEFLQIAQDRDCDLLRIEEGLRDGPHLVGGDRLDALHQVVQRKEAAE
jgi:hypothetical protein